MKIDHHMLLVIVAIIAVIIVGMMLMKKKPAEHYSFGASSNITESLMDDINNATYNG